MQARCKSMVQVKFGSIPWSPGVQYGKSFIRFFAPLGPWQLLNTVAIWKQLHIDSSKISTFSKTRTAYGYIHTDSASRVFVYELLLSTHFQPIRQPENWAYNTSVRAKQHFAVWCAGGARTVRAYHLQPDAFLTAAGVRLSTENSDGRKQTSKRYTWTNITLLNLVEQVIQSVIFIKTEHKRLCKQYSHCQIEYYIGISADDMKN